MNANVSATSRARVRVLRSYRLCTVAIALTLPLMAFGAQSTAPVKVTVDWNSTVAISKTTPNLEVEEFPELALSDQHRLDAAFSAIAAVKGRYVPYHTGGLVETKAPAGGQTFWNLKALDRTMVPFLEITKDNEPVIRFDQVPIWMFKGHQHEAVDPKKWAIGKDATELEDPSCHQAGEYFSRIVSWYVRGGFTDEIGQYHRSGYHYSLPWLELFNEIQAVGFEMHFTPKQYTECYDAIVEEVRKVSPGTQYVGLSLAPMGWLSGAVGSPQTEPEFYQYFLDHKNHRPGTPIDMIAYHFYASPSIRQTIASWQYSFFDQADGFINTVAFIESIRNRLSPETRVTVDESGVLTPTYWLYDPKSTKPSPALSSPPAAYWNLCGSLFAYLYIELAKKGVDAFATGVFLGDPTNPHDSLHLMDWASSQLNARYWVLKLLHDNFGPGDRLVKTQYDGDGGGIPPDLSVQAFITAKGKKLLALNKRSSPIELAIGGLGHTRQVETVDVSTGDHAPRAVSSSGDTLLLRAFAVSVIKLAD